VASGDRIGTTLGDYRIESLLGRGGMSVVYLARHTRLDRSVALKVMAEELSENETFRTRFIREAKMAANLEHTNIVPVYDAGEIDGVLFLAMRVIRGTDLRHVIDQQGPLDPERALTIAGQVASALDAAHRAGLVHRDVKPGNILLAFDGDEEHAFLTDFGLTKQVSSKSGLTKTGTFMGTVDYVAPEQIRGGEVGGRTDQYSLGCVVFECLTGRVPFAKDEEVATLFAHIEDERPSVSAVRPDLPAALSDAVARSMAKRPEDRFDTCQGFVRAAREALGAGTRAPTLVAPPPTLVAPPPLAAVAPASAPTAPVPAPPVPSGPVRPPGGKKVGRTLVFGAVIAAVAILGTVGAIALLGKDDAVGGATPTGTSGAQTTGPTASTETSGGTSASGASGQTGAVAFNGCNGGQAPTTLPDGTYFGRITNLATSGVLSFDLACHYTGEEADQKAAAAGAEVLADGSYIVNTNTMERPLILDPSATLKLIDRNQCCDTKEATDLEGFSESRNSEAPVEIEGWLYTGSDGYYWVKIENDKVVRIKEQFVPEAG